MRTVKAIVAVDQNRAIGFKGDLPWHVPEDLKYFANTTRGQTVLMGRNTWDSLKAPYKPLPGRLNIVCSRHPDKIVDESNSILRYQDPLEAIADFRQGKIPNATQTLWVVGGAQIYANTLHEWDELYLTQIFSSFEADTFFPEYDHAFRLVSSDDRTGDGGTEDLKDGDANSKLNYSFRIYKRK
jgi:dihydrofolate reductase